MQQMPASGSSPEVPVNENFTSINWTAVYGMDPATTTGLTWGYLGGRWGGFAVAAGTLALTGSGSPDTYNYVVVLKSSGAISVSTTATNWNDTANYARVYKILTAASAVNTVEDHRAGPHGVMSESYPTEAFVIRCGIETTAATPATSVGQMRMPYAFTLKEIRGSLVTPSEVGSPGAIVRVDVNKNGVSVFTTRLTFDTGEKTTTTAFTPAVIGTTALADDDEVTVDVDEGAASALGLKVTLIGTRA
jgi:hypothetical protein